MAPGQEGESRSYELADALTLRAPTLPHTLLEGNDYVFPIHLWGFSYLRF